MLTKAPSRAAGDAAADPLEGFPKP